jgi:hypothetical protein
MKREIKFVCKKCGRIASDPDENWHGVHCPDHPLADLVVTYEYKQPESEKQLNLFGEGKESDGI